MRPKRTSTFRKARPGEVFVFRTTFPVGLGGKMKMWGIFRVRHPLSDDYSTSVEFIGSDTGWSRFFETREEVLLFAESLGLKPEVLPFEPDLFDLVSGGELRPWKP